MCFVPEPKKDKTDGATTHNGAVSPNGENAPHTTQPPCGGDPTLQTNKLERPNSLGPGKLTRRLLCYHSEHCKSQLSLQTKRGTRGFVALVADGHQGPADGTPPPQDRHPHPPHLPPPAMGPMSGLMLSDLPEPPIPVSEIGPIPPPPMFSSPSPTPPRQVHMSDEGTCVDPEGKPLLFNYLHPIVRTEI